MKLIKPSWVHHDGNPIFSIDVHPDETRFVTGGQGTDSVGRVVIWNMVPLSEPKHENGLFINQSTEPLILCQLDHHNGCVNCVRWSHLGQYLASGGDDRIIIIWKLMSKPYSRGNNGNVNVNNAFGKGTYETWKSTSILRNHTGDVLDIAWSPNDRYLASASVDNIVIIWDVNNFPQIISILKGHSSLVKGVTWDPVGSYIATQSDDRSLRIWRTSDWKMEHVVTDPFVECGGTTHVLRLAWSPDGFYLVSAHAMNGGGPTAQIIERDGWKIDKDFVGHRKAIVCVRFYENMLQQGRVRQSCVALGSRDRSISVWSTALKRPVVVVKDVFSNSVMDLSWSSNGNTLMACSYDGTIAVAHFDYEEIGKPLTSSEMSALRQRFYGKSNITESSQIIQNMDVFLAREKLEKDKDKTEATLIGSSEAKLDKSNSEDISPNRNEPHTVGKAITVIKGPTDRQIETRTADGKRRITPKFLVPAVEEGSKANAGSSSPVATATANAFNSDIIAADSNLSSETNLRDKMVSEIDEVKDLSHDVATAPKQTSAKLTENAVERRKDEDAGKQSKIKGADVTLKDTENADKLKCPSKPNALNGVVQPDASKQNKDLLASKNAQSSPSIITESSTATNVTTKQNISEINEPARNSVEATSDSNITDARAQKVNSISVKRKRESIEDMPKSKKCKVSTVAQSPALTAPISSVIPKAVSGSDNVGANAHLHKHPKTVNKIVSKISRLPTLRIETSTVMLVPLKGGASYKLEVNNKRNSSGHQTVHQLKCYHSLLSHKGLVWTVCIDAPICAIAGNGTGIVAVSEDSIVHIFNLKGRYSMPPFLVPSLPSKISVCNNVLLLVTIKANMHAWDIAHNKVLIKSESLLPLLSTGDQGDSSKMLEVTYLKLTNGFPTVFISNGKCFIYHMEMSSWMLYRDPSGIVSNHLITEPSEQKLVESASKLSAEKMQRSSPTIISNVKRQLAFAIEMKHPRAAHLWLVVFASSLATHGMEKELRQLCEDLLNPITSTGRTKYLGLDTDAILKEILQTIVQDLRWQDMYTEFNDLLLHKETDVTEATTDILNGIPRK